MYVLIKICSFAGMATREDSCLLPIPTLGSVNEATGGARYIIIHLHVHTYMYIYTCIYMCMCMAILTYVCIFTWW